MGDVKNLTGTQAIKRMAELAEDIKNCMLCTYEDGTLYSRPMSTQKADEEGNIWFISDKDSRKNQQLANDNRVELIYAHGHDKFLAVHGTATIIYDRQKIKELWAPIAKIWFTEGEDDPRISVIKVTADSGYYWDTKHGKMIEMIKMAVAFATNKTMDDGIEGTLKT